MCKQKFQSQNEKTGSQTNEWIDKQTNKQTFFRK
jgi:hypothetical protein